MTVHSHDKALATKFLDALEIQDPVTPNHKPQLSQTSWRWVALFLLNVIVLGSYFVLEGPQPIETQIKAVLDLDDMQYGLLYSIGALPSIITPFMGSFFIDRLGARLTLVVFGLVVTMGQLVHSLGGFVLSYPLMMVGRIVFSLGTDPLNIAQMVMINKWFQGKESAFALSLSASTFGLGRALNSFLTPILYHVTGHLGAPMAFGTGLCLLGALLTFVMMKLDQENDRRALESGNLVETGPTEKLKLSDVKYFGPIVWVLIINFGLINGTTFSFNAFTNDFYHERYHFTNVQAGTIISSNFIFLALSSAIFGKIIDKYGYRASLTIIASSVGMLGFAYFFMYPECDECMSLITPQILFGIQLGVCEAALYSSLPLVLEEKYLGTGYGLFFVLENAIVFVLPSIGAYIKEVNISDLSDGYTEMIWFFCICNCIVVLAGFKLLFEDRKSHRVLDKTLGDGHDVDETRIEEEGELTKSDYLSPNL